MKSVWEQYSNVDRQYISRVYRLIDEKYFRVSILAFFQQRRYLGNVIVPFEVFPEKLFRKVVAYANNDDPYRCDYL